MPLRPRAVAVASDWWLAGGISAANCAAAYQAIGAADATAARVNLANPGTYNLTLGDAPVPGWSAEAGWSFTDSADYFKTGYTPDSNSANRAAIVRCEPSNTGNLQVVFGERNVFFLRYVTGTPNYHSFYNFGEYQYEDGFTSGVAAMSGTGAYLDGSSIGSMSGGNSACWGELTIGTMNGATSQGMVGTIQAIAFYSVAISSTQVAAVSAAMAAL